MLTSFNYVLFFVLIVILTFATGHDENEDYENDLDPEIKNNFAKIVGGSQTTIEKNPFLVQIKVNGTDQCCGTIIHNSWILTSAFCIGPTTPANLISIRSGATMLGTGGTVNNVSTVSVHQLYNATSKDYDFLLLQIAGNFTISNTTKIITIVSQGQNVPVMGMPAYTYGWGQDSSTSTTFSPILKEVKMFILDRIFCTNAGNFVTDRKFCVYKFSKGPCAGDMGCPVLYNRQLIGLVSHVTNCGSWRSPSVIAAINTVTAWIKGVAGV